MYIKLAILTLLCGIICLNPYSNGMKIECATFGLRKQMACLNPYSNGMYIKPTQFGLNLLFFGSLNPCCNGMKIEYKNIIGILVKKKS